MKDAIKIISILVVGLFVAIFLYPFLHELGHVIATVLGGSELYELSIFPIPYVACGLNENNIGLQNIIGVSGMLLPFLITCIVRSNRYLVWLILFYLKGIAAMSFGISYIAVLCFQSGFIWENEDIVKVVQLSRIDSSVWLFLMLVFFCISFLSLYSDMWFFHW